MKSREAASTEMDARFYCVKYNRKTGRINEGKKVPSFQS